MFVSQSTTPNNSTSEVSEFTSEQNPQAYLRWQDRTPIINHCIQQAFESLACKTVSEWTFNGTEIYGIGRVKEHKLMRQIIQNTPTEKNFYVLDIGAGDYQWGRKLAAYLNEKKDIPNDVTIHVIGIRGEQQLDKRVSQIGQCKLYELGQFKIETLAKEFQERRFDLEKKVDLIVSKWCFRHLVDPVGTFVQTYDLLRPKTGYLLVDGFYFLHENEQMNDTDFDDNMIELCLETKAPFLYRIYPEARSLDHFVINRQDERPCYVHKQYIGVEKIIDGLGEQIFSNKANYYVNLTSASAY